MQPLRIDAPHTFAPARREGCAARPGAVRGPHHKRKLLELCARIGYTPPRG